VKHIKNPIQNEFTLCGIAFDAGDSGDAEEGNPEFAFHLRFADCIQCRQLALFCAEQAEPLRVVRAAIMDDRGGIHSVPKPGRHHDVIREMVKRGHPKPIPNLNQGFVLSDGRFVNRKAAAQVARKAGQLRSEVRGCGLCSEDVW
jgi:hypothetical protein